MNLEERMKKGMLFYEHGHKDPVDIACWRRSWKLRESNCKEVMFDYNSTRPSEDEKRQEILKGILEIAEIMCLSRTRYICLMESRISVNIFMPTLIW